MRTIRVQRVLKAPMAEVFDVLADHAGYTRFPCIRAASVLRPGSPDPNGVGALRRVEIGPMFFEEEITAFERPHLLEYQIRRSRPPVRHRDGRVKLTPAGEEVDVEWTSTLEVAVPLVGGLATRALVAILSRGFDATLRTARELALR